MQYHKLLIDKPFAFEAGGVLPRLEVAYHTSPRPYTEGEKVVWICHALTANSDAQDWWPQMVGPGRLFDTDRYYVVCVNMLGSPYGSSSPATVNPETGRPYMLDFPKVTVRDIIRVTIEVRKALGIKQVDLLVGSSIGGFQALEWAIMEPEVIRQAAFMATSARVTPYLAATEESQRMALEADASFRECASMRGGEMGLRCARSIALISYRSFDGYDATQQDADPDTLFSGRAASYQQHQGKKLSDRFDAYCYYTLSYSVDSANVGRGRGGVDAALRQIRAKSTVVAIDSDCIFPPKVMRPMADAIPGARYHLIHSLFGHDGFLLETQQLSDILSPLLHS